MPGGIWGLFGSPGRSGRRASVPTRLKRRWTNGMRASRNVSLSEARSRLYQQRFWPPNNHFAAFFKIYKICTLLHRSELNFLEKVVKNFQNCYQNFRNLKFWKILQNFVIFFFKITKFLTKFCKILRFERRKIVIIL